MLNIFKNDKKQSTKGSYWNAFNLK
jgi:hypothetical protein